VAYTVLRAGQVVVDGVAAAVAVSAVIREGPVNPMLSVPVAALVSPPVPANAVFTVNEPLLVRTTDAPVTVTLGTESVPESAWELVSKVWTPLPAVNVPLFVMPLRKVTAEFAEELSQVPPAATVTSPLKILAPVAEDIARLPLLPPPT